MKIKNKLTLLLISYIFVIASVFIAIPQGASASANDIINGGASTKAQLKSRFSKASYVFQHYGIKKADIDGLRNGTVHKNGNIFVGNKKVATNARSTGRQALGCSNKVFTMPNGNKIYEGSTNCRFASSSLAAFVKLNQYGQFEYAIIKNCANPTVGKNTVPKPTPPKPSIKINKSVNKKTPLLGETFTYAFTAKNTGATALKNVKITDPAPRGGNGNQLIEFIPDQTEKQKGLTVKKGSVTVAVGNLAKGASTPTYKVKAKFIRKSDKNLVKNEVCITGKSTNANAKPQNVKDCATAQNKTNTPNNTITTTEQLSLEITKAVDKPEVNIGEEFTYTITLKNPTTKDIGNIKLADSILTPDFIELVPDSGTNGLVVSTASVALKSEFVLKAGETQTFTLRAKYKESVSTGVTGINQVCVEAQPVVGLICTTAENKPITSTPPSITVTKDVSKERVRLGEAFTYTVKVTNISQVDIPSLNMLDAQPEGVEFIADTATNGATISSGDPFKTGKETIWFSKANFPLKAGETQEFSLQAKLVEEVAGEIVNVACANNGAEISACDNAKNVTIPAEPPAPQECAEGIPVGDERCTPVLESLPAAIASTGPGAVAASVVGVSALGYGARQWIASRRAMHEAIDKLYKK